MSSFCRHFFLAIKRTHYIIIYHSNISQWRVFKIRTQPIVSDLEFKRPASSIAPSLENTPLCMNGTLHVQSLAAAGICPFSLIRVISTKTSLSNLIYFIDWIFLKLWDFFLKFYIFLKRFRGVNGIIFCWKHEGECWWPAYCLPDICQAATGKNRPH